MHRIGYLGSSGKAAGFHEAFRQGLRDNGWVEGQNIAIDYRFAENKPDRLPALAAELVRLKVELIVAQPTPAALAAKKATSTIPIVMINAGDPERLGLVESLANPGGNVTGTSYGVGLTTIVKALEFLKEAMPAVRLVGVLSNPNNPTQSLAVEDLTKAAKSLDVRLEQVQARGPEEFERAFAEMSASRVEALLVIAEGVFILHAAEIAPAFGTWSARGRRSRRPDVIRAKLATILPACGNVRGQDPEGSQAFQSAGRATHPF